MGLVIKGVGLAWGLKGWMWFGPRKEREVCCDR